MQDSPAPSEPSMSELTWPDWLAGLGERTGDDGYCEPLGDAHAALFLERNPVLLVSFESFDDIRDLSETGEPLGWGLAQALGWSHLCLLSREQSWFRENRIYGYFDRLVDDGLFEDFEQVIFYGAGPCGYAAAAYSVAAPGARVVAIQPQATLDPRIAEWDDRFRHMRRTSFTDRYGYAPDMLDAAQEAFVLYDPEITLDAMHAALFARPNVTRMRMRFLGDAMVEPLMRMNLLYRILAQASAGKLNRLNLARLFRARRDDRGYQFNLLQRLTHDKRHYLIVLLAHHVLAKRNARPFRKALRQARAVAEKHGLSLPEQNEAG